MTICIHYSVYVHVYNIDVTSTFEITNEGLVWGYSIMELKALTLIVQLQISISKHDKSKIQKLNSSFVTRDSIQGINQ